MHLKFPSSDFNHFDHRDTALVLESIKNIAAGKKCVPLLQQKRNESWFPDLFPKDLNMLCMKEIRGQGSGKQVTLDLLCKIVTNSSSKYISEEQDFSTL